MALGLISLIWVFVGFSLSFGDSFLGLIGNPFQHFYLITLPLVILDYL